MAAARKKVNWENLPEGPLMEIADRVERFQDFDAVTNWVCREWRSTLKNSTFQGKSPQVPLLMLPDNNCGGRRPQPPPEFYSLSNRRFRDLTLPELDAGVELFSSKGWLLVVSGGLSMFLFNPISRTRIPLPSFHPYNLTTSKFPPCVIQKFALSANPSASSGGGNSNYVVAVIYNGERIAIWRPADPGWTRLENNLTTGVFFDDILDVTFYGGNLYAVSAVGQIAMASLSKNELKLKAWLELPSLFCCDRHGFFSNGFLVDLACDEGKLWFLHWERTRFSFYIDNTCHGFRVMEIDVNSKSVVEIDTLGNRSIFLGNNQSFSIEVGEDDSKHYLGCRPDCIYFTLSLTTKRGLMDLGVYNMANGTFESLFQGRYSTYPIPPLWVEPRS